VGYVIAPSASARREVRRIAAERLGEAVERLDTLIDAVGDDADVDTDVEEAIHEIRKRCKEVRGLARLVGPALGSRFHRFDRTVRSAANELSALRDAHAVLATFDTLVDAQPTGDSGARHDLRAVRAGQAAFADAATEAAGSGDDRIRTARDLLQEALAASQKWKVPAGFEPLGDGLGSTYDRGRRWLRRAEKHPTDERLHEWRKAVKHLWYQTRLLHDTAPSVMGPLADNLDDLAEALGDDHDLAVLVARLDGAGAGTAAAVGHTVDLARARQAELRRRAFRMGHTIYAEDGGAFVARVQRYWLDTVRLGPELVVGGIATLSRERSEERASGDSGSGRELERKFRLDGGLRSVPGDLERCGSSEIRQGYLAVDGAVSVRVRDAGDCTLTVKWRTEADGPGERGELEWTIARQRFESAWPATAGRRVVKTRHRVGLDRHTVEIDVFHDELDGLVVAEVEFDSPDALRSFEPPPWFGDEVTDDRRYRNASLAVDGRPDP